MFESKPVDIRIEEIATDGNSVRFRYRLYFEGSRYPSQPISDEEVEVFLAIPEDGLRASALQVLGKRHR